MHKLLNFFLAIMLLITLNWFYSIPAQAFNGITGATIEQTCEHKILSTGTLTGQFLGVECGDYCYATIKLDNREETRYLLDVDPEYLDNLINKKVVFTFYLEQNSFPEDPDECRQIEVIKTIELAG
jgi:hypothetical protein